MKRSGALSLRWVFSALVALALGHGELAAQAAMALERCTGVVSRVLPDAIELKSKQGSQSFHVSEANLGLLGGVQPGDRVTISFERNAQDMRILKKGKPHQKPGKTPGDHQPGNTIIDDRAFYGAENANEEGERPHG